MAKKTFCDICNREIEDRIFRSELVVVYVKDAIFFVQHQKKEQPQIVEKHYQFCKDCLSEKLPNFVN